MLGRVGGEEVTRLVLEYCLGIGKEKGEGSGVGRVGVCISTK